MPEHDALYPEERLRWGLPKNHSASCEDKERRWMFVLWCPGSSSAVTWVYISPGIHVLMVFGGEKSIRSSINGLMGF
jgi:hypothetical protein